MRTSILDRFCAPLCEVVCQETGEATDAESLSGEEHLRWLQESNLFLISLDGDNEWFRFHHLFRAHLGNLLEQRLGSQEIATIQVRASKWLAENGHIDEAIQHALQAGDVALALDYVYQYRYQLMNNEKWIKLERLIKLFPDDLVMSDPVLAVTMARIAIYRGQIQDWPRYLDAAVKSVAALPTNSPIRKTVSAEILPLTGLRAVISGQPAKQIIADAERAVETLPEEDLNARGLAIGILAAGFQMAGNWHLSFLRRLPAMSVAETVNRILRENRFTAEDVSELEGKLFFEGDKRLPYLVRFTVLLFLSAIIATFGVLQDSTATVIGAMLVAPLMTPMMAITAALVMGRLKRVSQSFLIVLYGTVMVMGVAFLVGFLTVNVISATADSQIAARIRPNLDDLIVAIAAGAAGAFAYSRDDVADSLPGVAIAIALVPPLAVVGLTLSQGSWFAALGAFLLFLTNFLSILLAGGVVFALLNLSGASIKGKDIPRQAQLKAYRYIVIGVLIVAVPLAFTSYRVARDTFLQSRAQEIVKSWLEESESEVELVGVKVFDNSVNVSLADAEEPEAIEELGQSINERHPHLDDITVQINYSKVIPLPIAELEDE